MAEVLGNEGLRQVPVLPGMKPMEKTYRRPQRTWRPSLWLPRDGFPPLASAAMCCVRLRSELRCASAHPVQAGRRYLKELCWRSALCAQWSWH